MKRTIILLVAFCLLFGSIGSYSLAANVNNVNFDNVDKEVKDIEYALAKLKKQRDINLELIKEQLKQQGMMEHYHFHAELVNQEYEALKQEILGIKYSPMSNRRVYVPRGGQVEYRVEPSDDKRTHARFIIDAYDKAATAEIIREFDRNNRVTLADIGRFIVYFILDAKISGIGPLLSGIDGAILFRNFLTAEVIQEVERSSTKCILSSSVSHYGGSSSSWRVLDSMPYIAISQSARGVKITEF